MRNVHDDTYLNYLPERSSKGLFVGTEWGIRRCIQNTEDTVFQSIVLKVRKKEEEIQ